MAVLGGWAVSYERGAPVFLGQTQKRDVYYNHHARHVSTPAEDLSEQNLESL